MDFENVLKHTNQKTRTISSWNKTTEQKNDYVVKVNLRYHLEDSESPQCSLRHTYVYFF